MLQDSLVGLRAPAFAPGDWLNSTPLSLTDLNGLGQPVLIHFWASSCTNSRRTLPALARWWQTYQNQGLVVIGIHTPVLTFENDLKSLVTTLEKLGVSWPIIHDSLKQNWQAYDNRYWPRQLLIDSTGTIVLDQIGEGGYEDIEHAIQRLLTRHGARKLPEILTQGHQHKLNLTCYPASPDAQLGHQRGTLKNRPVVLEKSTQFTDPALPQHPGVALQGRWIVNKDSIAHVPTDTPSIGYISVVFSGFEAILVAKPSDTRSIKLIITLNGNPIPIGDRGSDIEEYDSQTTLNIDEAKPYQLIQTNRYLSPAELRCSDESGRLIAYAIHFSGCHKD